MPRPKAVIGPQSLQPSWLYLTCKTSTRLGTMMTCPRWNAVAIIKLLGVATVSTALTIRALSLTRDTTSPIKPFPCLGSTTTSLCRCPRKGCASIYGRVLLATWWSSLSQHKISQCTKPFPLIREPLLWETKPRRAPVEDHIYTNYP